MTLAKRLAFTSLAVALPVATGLTFVVEGVRTHVRTQAVINVVQAQVSTAFRERCESDPGAISTGEITPKVDPNAPDEAPPPRGKYEPRPFELFVYDDTFIGQHALTPRFPEDFKRALRANASLVSGPFEVKDSVTGTGAQAAVMTNWIGSPCRVLLARMRPAPHETLNAFLWFVGFFALSTGIGMAVSGETMWRLVRSSTAARHLAESDYRDIMPVTGGDEIGTLTFALNEASADIRRRIAEAKDRDNAFARFVASTTSDTTKPFADIRANLASADADAQLSSTPRTAVRAAITELNDLESMLHNLVAAAKLRAREEAGSRANVDLRAVASSVIAQSDPVARAAGVSLTAALPSAGVMIAADTSLIERVVSNLIDNAIRYNRPGGHVSITLSRDAGSFSLLVADDGQGVSDEELKQLTNVRRFRGDEAKVRRPNSIGLGLAVVREACDRFGIEWAFRRPRGTGFEAELTGKTTT